MSRLLILASLSLFSFGCGTRLDENFCPGLNSCLSQNVVYQNLFFDDFNRSNGSIGSNYIVVEDGGTTISISNNEVQLGRNNITGLTPIGFYSNSLSDENIRLSADFQVTGTNFNGASGFIGLVARSQSSSNSNQAYFCQIDALTTKQLQLFLSPSGILESSSGTAPLANGDRYQLTFTIEGNQLTCKVSGAANFSISATDDSFSSGYSGITGGVELFVEAVVDNFLIEVGS